MIKEKYQYDIPVYLTACKELQDILMNAPVRGKR
jgi:hypothetical protein